MREIAERDAFFQGFFADSQIAVVAIAINEFCVLVDLVRLVYQLPRRRRKIDDVINLGAGVAVFLQSRGEMRGRRSRISLRFIQATVPQLQPAAPARRYPSPHR